MLSQGQAVSGPNAEPRAADQAGSGFELSQLLQILVERYKLILGAALIGLILGIVASLLMTPLYRASAMLEINPQVNDLLETGSQQRAGGRGNSQELLQTQMGLLRSESLARRVVEVLNLASDPVYGGTEGTRQQRTDRAAAIILGGTSVDPVKGAMLIQVSHVSANQEMAMRVANALSSEFIASSLERRFDSSSYARKFLSDQLARTKVALEESERGLNAYSIESGVFRLPGAQGADGRTSEGSTLAQTDLTALTEALNVARVRRINAEQAFRSSSTDFVAEQAANLSTLVQQRADLQAQYEEKAQVFKPDYPVMRELQARISRLDTVLNSERRRTSGSKRAELRGEFLSAQNAEAQIAARVAAAKGEVQGERSRSIQYNILQREADTNRALYDALLQRYKEIGVAGGIGQSIVSLVDQADAPRGAFSPQISVNAGFGLMLGLAIGIALAFMVHLLFDAITDPADVRTKLHMPVLGVIPFDTEDRTLLEALADRKSDVSEAYYSVRTALKFSQPEGAPRTLLVTSTKPGEGKSTSAYAIASSMARLGSKVLLIDADLRKPTFVSRREDGNGFAHLLGSEDPLSGFVETTQIDNLTLMPVGRFVGSAAELLSSNRLPAIMAEAREHFDMVVIDGPPVLGLTDAPLLASAAEATVLVIESRGSRTGAIQEIVRRLNEAGAKLVGVILTKVTRDSGSYGYSYYSYNYGDGDVGGQVSSDPARALDLSRGQA